MIKKLLPPIIVILVLTVGFEIVLDIARVPKFIVPKPSLVFQALAKNWQWILVNLRVTVAEAVIGFTLSIFLAMLLSLSCLFFPRLEPVVVPLAVAVRNVPFVAIAPILFMALGYGPLPKIVIVIVVSFFPIMSNLSAGLASITTSQRERFFVLRATRWQLFRKLQLPASIPYLVVGLEIAVSNIIIAAIVGELLGTNQGLGYVIVMSVSQYRFPLLMAAVVVTTVVSILMTWTFRVATKLLLRRWLN